MKWIKSTTSNNEGKFSLERPSFIASQKFRPRSGVHSYTETEDEIILRRKRKIKQALKQQLKLGKINRKQFNALKKRMNDIANDLVAFGNSAGVILGKKYVCGVIDKKDYEQIKCDLLPASLEEEKEFIEAEFFDQKEHYLMFRDVSAHDKHVCQKCHKDEMFYSKLYQAEGMKLCRSCYEVYRKVKYYGGTYGKFVICSPAEMNPKAVPEFVEREYI